MVHVVFLDGMELAGKNLWYYNTLDIVYFPSKPTIHKTCQTCWICFLWFATNAPFRTRYEYAAIIATNSRGRDYIMRKMTLSNGTNNNMRKNDLLFYGCSIRFESYWNKENYDDKYFDIWYIFSWNVDTYWKLLYSYFYNYNISKSKCKIWIHFW